MMLIAAGLAAVLFAAASLVPDSSEIPAGSTSSSTPPVVVTIFSEPGVSSTLVQHLLAEAGAIWRPSGVELVWRRATQNAVPPSRILEPGPYSPSILRVVIGHRRGVSRDNETPLGWIVFDDEHEPQPEIYVSYANAQSLMESARPVLGVIDQMPTRQHDLLLARAMGRALAHELGHYLLASKVHTQHGLLKARRTASDLFSIGRSGFAIDAAQRQQIAARMRGESLVVSR